MRAFYYNSNEGNDPFFCYALLVKEAPSNEAVMLRLQFEKDQCALHRYAASPAVIEGWEKLAKEIDPELFFEQMRISGLL